MKGMSIRSKALLLITGFLIISTVYVSVTRSRIDYIVTSPFTVLNKLGVEYLAICFSWILYMFMLLFVRGSINDKQVLFTASISVLMLTYLIYSLPRSLFENQFYVDQLGFVLEVRSVTANGHFQSFQGGLESCGHALFSGIFAKILGVSYWSLTEWLPHLFVYLTVIMLFSSAKALLIGKEEKLRLRLLAMTVPILFLITNFFSAFQYSRQSFAYPLHTLSILMLILMLTKRDMKHVIAYIILFSALLISHPASSLIVALMSLTAWIFMTIVSKFGIAISQLSYRRLILSISLFSILAWFSFQLSIYGSIVSFLKQTKVAFKELFESPIPERTLVLGPGYTWEGYLYFSLRLRWGQFIILMSTVLAITAIILRRVDFIAKVIALWILLYVIGIGFTIYAHRWMDRPFQYLALITPLLLVSLAKNHYRPTTVSIYSILIVGILISPITIWGSSPFMYPPSSDIIMAQFLSNHAPETPHRVAYTGSHGLLPFYYKLNGKTLSGKDLLGSFKQEIGFNVSEVCEYDIVAVFFRTYGKSGFYEYEPSIYVAVSDLQEGLVELGYNKIFEVVPGEEWAVTRV